MTEKAKMPSGRLAFATRRVDLMAANMRAPFWLSVRMADHSPHQNSWKKLDQMVVVRVQGAPRKFAICQCGLHFIFMHTNQC